jgi:general secretion pathway protein C
MASRFAEQMNQWNKKVAAPLQEKFHEWTKRAASWSKERLSANEQRSFNIETGKLAPYLEKICLALQPLRAKLASIPRKQYVIWSFIILGGYGIADLSVLLLRGAAMPDWSQMPSRTFRPRKAPVRTVSYQQILERNIFNSDGVIPPGLGSDLRYDPNKAVPTQLPLLLLATVIHEDPAQSVAIIRTKEESLIRREGEAIESIADIVGIQRGRVYFYTARERRLEFLQLPVDEEIPLGEFGVENMRLASGPREFEIEKKVIEEHTKNLPQLLQQARAVPQKGPGGSIEGFRIDMLQEGSLFEKLGIRVGDVIEGVNGQKVDSPEKAIQLYNKLRNEPNIQLSINRGGRSENLSYSVN